MLATVPTEVGTLERNSIVTLSRYHALALIKNQVAVPYTERDSQKAITRPMERRDG